MTDYLFVSEDIYPELLMELKTVFRVVKLRANSKCYRAVAKHSDILMTVIDGELYVDDSLKEALIHEDNLCGEDYKNIHFLKTDLGDTYPKSVCFNGKYNGKYFIHNLDYTDPSLLSLIKEWPLKTELIHVKQGYTGCSMILLKNEHVITADKGICRTLKAKGFNVLLIDEGHIILEGMDYGFIGGCVGIFNNRLYVNGDLNFHSNGKEMIEFIHNLGYEIVMVEGKELIDIGGMIIWQN